MTITITSEAFKAGEPIPKEYTGEGEDRSPAPLLERGAGRGEGIGSDLRRSRRPDKRAVGALVALQDTGGDEIARRGDPTETDHRDPGRRACKG